jgi:hypothetical protein
MIKDVRNSFKIYLAVTKKRLLLHPALIESTATKALPKYRFFLFFQMIINRL